MASLSVLPQHLRAIKYSRSSADLPSSEIHNTNPAIDALLLLWKFLNTLSRYPQASSPPSPLKLSPSSSAWFQEQQDAQEFFQKLTGLLSTEASKIWKQRRANIKNGLESLLKESLGPCEQALPSGDFLDPFE